jgi:hypothetical protein
MSTPSNNPEDFLEKIKIEAGGPVFLSIKGENVSVPICHV